MSKLAGKPCLYCTGPIMSRGPKRDATVIYCSRKCSRRDQVAKSGARATKSCTVCGDPFTYYASVRPNATYCSLKCKNRAHNQKKAGRITPGQGPSTFRKSMRRFFYDRCAICGWDLAPCDVAHIVSRKDGCEDVLENVVMLCPNDHRLFDLGKIPVEQVRQARMTVLRQDFLARDLAVLAAVAESPSPLLEGKSGYFRFTAARTFAFSAGVPFADTRDRALAPRALVFTGYASAPPGPPPGNA
jgi:hypothetical protein